MPGETGGEQTRWPLSAVGWRVKPGDYLIAVNGEPAPATASPYSYFQNLAGQVVTLKVSSKPGAEGAWEIVVKPIANEAGVRYLDWIENNRRIGSETTGGRLGYM